MVIENGGTANGFAPALSRSPAMPLLAWAFAAVLLILVPQQPLPCGHHPVGKGGSGCNTFNV